MNVVGEVRLSDKRDAGKTCIKLKDKGKVSFLKDSE